jgi:chorismate synthase
MKPQSTLKKRLKTLDMETREPAEAFQERTDACAVPAAGVVCEAVVALVLADAVLEKFGGDTMDELKASFDIYLKRVSERLRSPSPE